MMSAQQLFDDLFNKSDGQIDLTQSNKKTYSRYPINRSNFNNSFGYSESFYKRSPPRTVELMEVDSSDQEKPVEQKNKSTFDFPSDGDDDLDDEIIPSPVRRRINSLMKKDRQSESKSKSTSNPATPKQSLSTRKTRNGSPYTRIIIPDSSSESDSNEAHKMPDSRAQDETEASSKCDNYKSDSSIRLPEIDKNSVRSLEPGRMLNDTIIEFYMNHHFKSLANQTTRHRFHLFNTFIYNKLKALHRQLSLKPGENSENCFKQTISRWYKTVRLLDKDFLVIPICDSQHWVLAIICFANKVPAHDEPMVINDEQAKGSAEEPCILIFDSLGFKQMSKFTDPIRSFLNERWRFERPEDEPRNFKDRTSFRDIQAKVPRQRNTYDCGIHLLVSFERFLDSPMHLYEKIKNREDVTQEFRENDMRLKRHRIRSLLPVYSSNSHNKSSSKKD